MLSIGRFWLFVILLPAVKLQLNLSIVNNGHVQGGNSVASELFPAELNFPGQGWDMISNSLPCPPLCAVSLKTKTIHKRSLSPNKNVIWTVQWKNSTGQLMGFVSGEPPTQHSGDVTVQTLSVPLSEIIPSSLTFDYQNATLYFANIADASYYRIYMSNPVKPSITVVHRGFVSPIQLAMDWSTGNLYWADISFSWIAMKPVKETGTSDFKILVESDVEKPYGLALDPRRGYMFWPERRTTPVIRRAGLDGADVRVIVVGGIIAPQAMTIDVEKGKIYWVDIAKDTLESCLNDGRERRIIKKINGLNFAGVAYYKNTLFVTDDVTKHVFVIRDETGVEQALFRADSNGDPRSIIVYAGELQPRLSDPCLRLNCEHFCVRTVSSARCLCQDGYTLSTDGHSCIGSTIYSPRLLSFASKTHVCFVDITTFIHTVSPNCPVTNGADITAIVSDPHRWVVYYADRRRNKIYMISLRTGEISAVVSNVGQVEGLTFDWLTNTIYWTDSSSNSINSWGIISSIRTTKTVAVSGILGRLTVDPFSRRIFFVTTSPARIIVKGYGSRDASRILVNSDINRPADIHCDPVKQRIFWADSGSIKVVNMDGTGQKTLISTFESNNRGLVASKSFIFWTSRSAQSTLNAGRTEDGNLFERITIQNSPELVDIDVLDASAQQTTRGQCFHNGGCDHYCIPMPGGRECRCELGYKLQADGRTCTTEYLQNEHIIVADLDAKRLYQVDINSEEVFGSFLLNDFTPAVAVDPSSKVLYWSDLVQRNVKSSQLNGSSIKTLFDTGLEFADRLATDPSTGNIFYTANPILSQTVGRGYIGVASPDGKFQRRLVIGLNRPRALDLHSSQGIMFWSDHGNDPHIGRANMDGSQRESIISTNIKLPNGVAIDFEENLLYWSDGFRDVIERCSFYGANRQVILKDRGANLMALVINKNKLYYTAWNRPGITVVNKADGTNSRLLAESPLYGELSDLIIVRPNIGQTVNNACSIQNGGCSTFCLPTQTSKTCACADGIDLQLDGLTCVGAIVPTRREIQITRATDTSTERHVGSEVIIASITAATIVVVVVLVGVTVIMVRRKRTRRPQDTVVYSRSQSPRVPIHDRYSNNGYPDYSYIHDSVPPPVPPDHPPPYIELQDGNASGYTYPKRTTDQHDPKF